MRYLLRIALFDSNITMSLTTELDHEAWPSVKWQGLIHKEKVDVNDNK